MRPSPLDRSRVSAHAWARFRWLMKLMAAVTVLVILIAFAYFYAQGEQLSVHFYIALGLGIAGAMFMTGGLMGLVFLSSGTGHDEAVSDLHQEDHKD
jgi:hypothetical protein